MIFFYLAQHFVHLASYFNHIALNFRPFLQCFFTQKLPSPLSVPVYALVARNWKESLKKKRQREVEELAAGLIRKPEPFIHPNFKKEKQGCIKLPTTIIFPAAIFFLNFEFPPLSPLSQFIFFPTALILKGR